MRHVPAFHQSKTRTEREFRITRADGKPSES
jgi:hypothetical protein